MAIQWDQSFPYSGGAGITGTTDGTDTAEYSVEVVVPNGAPNQPYNFDIFIGGQSYGGGPLVEGPNSFSFALPDGVSGIVRALAFDNTGGTDGSTVNIPQAPSADSPSDLVAENDFADTTAGVAVVVDILANDTIAGEPVTLDQLDGLPVVIEVRPSGAGTAAIGGNGALTFTPAPGFDGEVQVDYRITERVVCATVVLQGEVPQFIDSPDWLGQIPVDGSFGIQSTQGAEWYVSFYVDSGGGFAFDGMGGDVPSNVETECNLTDGKNTICCHFTYIPGI